MATVWSNVAEQLPESNRSLGSNERVNISFDNLSPRVAQDGLGGKRAEQEGGGEQLHDGLCEALGGVGC